jgi:peptidoglycan-associated lipoprotein
MNRLFFAAAVLLLLAGCATDKHLKRGNQYWAIGEYYDASQEYAKAYAKTSPQKKEERGALAYRIGDCNRLMNFTAKALTGYRNAARYGYTDTLTYYYIGEMQRRQRDYKNAAKSYQQYLEKYPNDPAALIGLRSCDYAPRVRAKGSDYTVRLDKQFNARYADYSPMLANDQIFFSSTRREATGDEASGITGMKNGDIFFAKKDEKGKWQRPEAVQGGVNTAYDEGACAFTPDGQTMYYTSCRWDAQYPRRAEIYQSQRSDATWGKGTKVAISNDTLSNFAHPAVSPDGKYLYFVSDMPGGLGGTDIWRIALTGDHGLGALENLGAPVNTPGNERFPTFRSNGDLYYSSDGKEGLGGLDIYMAQLDTFTNKWSVSHLPYPVNSNGDDFGMTFDGQYNSGFFSSNRANSRGWDKIYSFECPDITQTLTGWVYEQDGYELPKAVVYMIGDDGTNKKIGLKLDGSFEETVKPGVHYVMLATCDGYLNYRQSLYLPLGVGRVDTTLQFPLPSTTIPVLVKNVFYAFNKATILPSSIPALDGLTTLLKGNPSIAIELSSHCDYRGSDAYNEKLSQHRAQAVVDYLTSHGISKNRVVARGYGKRKPKVITPKFAERYPFLHAGDTLTVKFIKRLSPARQDSCNALNRRTEFSVLKTTYGLLDENGKLKQEVLTGKTTEEPAPKANDGKKQPEKPGAPSAARNLKNAKATPAAKGAAKDAAAAASKTPAATSKNAAPASKNATPAQKGKNVKTAAKTTAATASKTAPAAATTAAAKATPAAAKSKSTTATTKAQTARATTPASDHKATPKQDTAAKKTAASTTQPAAKPESATPQKAAATTKTTAATAKPAAQESKAASATAKPAAQESKAASATAKPAAGESKAASATAKPAAGESKATSATAKPATQESKAASATTKPAAGESKTAQTTAKNASTGSATKAATSKVTKPSAKAAAQTAKPSVAAPETIAEPSGVSSSSGSKPRFSVRKQREPTSAASAARLEAKAQAKAAKKAAKVKAKEEKQRLKAEKKKAKELEKAQKAAEKARQKAEKQTPAK